MSAKRAAKLVRRAKRKAKRQIQIAIRLTPKANEILREMSGMTEGLSPEAAAVHAGHVLEAEGREPGLGLSVFRDIHNIRHVLVEAESEEGRERCKDFFRRFARYTNRRIEDALAALYADDENPDEAIQKLTDALPGLLDTEPPPTGERRAQ